MNIRIFALCVSLLLLTLSGNTSASNSDVVFDHIIIGSGAGGLAIAEEYSRDPNIRIAWFEQGTYCTDCDASLGAQSKDNSVHQQRLFPIQQQFNALLRQPTMVEFHSFGGNTKLMGNVYTRPTATFLDTQFPTGFKSGDLLPYYMEDEQHFCHTISPLVTNISTTSCQTYHGANGKIQVAPQVFPVLSETIHAFVDYAATNPNIGVDYDYNDYTHGGVAYEQNFKKMSNMSDLFSARSRGDPQIAFFSKALLAARPNLVLFTNSKVERILINPTTKNTQGVVYSVNGTDEAKAFARGRVWVCAGALRTPQLLQVSGVGSEELLRSIGVQVIANNPAIGATLKAHQALIMGYQTKQAIAHNSTYSSYNALDWWFSTGLSAYPDIQVEILEGLYVSSVEGAADSFPLSVLLGFLGGQTSLPYLAMEIESLTPSAVGYVRARTPSMNDAPEWDLGWSYADFFGSTDLAKLLIAISTVRAHMTGNNTFANKYIQTEVWPGNYFILELAKSGITSDAIAMAAFGLNLQETADLFFIQYYLTHFFHITSTVPLGVATDLHGAVNGVRGLNVCDNGVLPANPDGNPTPTTLAVCRKLAREQILADM